METDRKEAFIAAMDKERLRDEIRIHGTFIIQYRLMIDGVPTYVNLKATTLVDSERFMIVGVNNIDAQVRERAAARKASEERDVFARLSALNGNMMVLYFVAAQIIENGRPVLIVGVLDKNAAKIEEHNVSGRGAGGIQIAYGVARFEADESAEVVFERTDRRMYKRKAQMKTVG